MLKKTKFITFKIIILIPFKIMLMYNTKCLLTEKKHNIFYYKIRFKRTITKKFTITKRLVTDLIDINM